MFELLLFATIAALMGLFAFGAAGAGHLMVAVPAAVLAVWFGLMAAPIARAQVRTASSRRSKGRQ